MKSKELNKLLLKEFPELESKIYDEISWQDGFDTGSHVVYGDILNPYIIETIKNAETEKVKKIFDFIEKLVLSKDEYASNVMSTTVIENLVGFQLSLPNSKDKTNQQKIEEVINCHIGKNTRGIYELVGKEYFGKDLSQNKKD